MDASEKQALIDGLKEKHGNRLFEVSDEDSDYGLVVIRPLTRLEYRKLKQLRDDETRKHMADEHVIKTAVVYPDTVAVEKLIDQYPVFAPSVMVEVLKVSGAENLQAKKL